MSKFDRSTAIDYVNGTPHVGHAYEKILADCLARYHRLAGDDTFFLTGTDEHGQNVERAARERGLDPQTHADQLAPAFEAAWRHLLISNDRFVRTTEPAHARAPPALFAKIDAAGDIDRVLYEGLYS